MVWEERDELSRHTPGPNRRAASKNSQPVGHRGGGMFSTFLEVLDTTIVNVSLPHIAGSLSASVHEATWVLTSYLVTTRSSSR